MVIQTDDCLALLIDIPAHSINHLKPEQNAMARILINGNEFHQRIPHLGPIA